MIAMPDPATFAVVALFPYAVMLSTALKPGDEIIKVNEQWVMQAPRRSARTVSKPSGKRPTSSSAGASRR